jgi:polyisoprenoid-binding protein YceI
MRSLILTLWLCLLWPTGVAQLGAEVLPGSEVRYTAQEPRGSFSGVAPPERVALTLYPDNLRRTQLSVTVRPERFDSGVAIRDINARRTVFESATYPEIRFELTRVVSPEALPDAGAVSALLQGTLHLHGETRPLEVPVTLERQGETLTATGSFEVALSDFGMRRPSFLFYTVEDAVAVSFALRLALK